MLQMARRQEAMLTSHGQIAWKVVLTQKWKQDEETEAGTSSETVRKWN